MATPEEIPAQHLLQEPPTLRNRKQLLSYTKLATALLLPNLLQLRDTPGEPFFHNSAFLSYPGDLSKEIAPMRLSKLKA